MKYEKTTYFKPSYIIIGVTFFLFLLAGPQSRNVYMGPLLLSCTTVRGSRPPPFTTDT